jgi:hypothetical protein
VFQPHRSVLLALALAGATFGASAQSIMPQPSRPSPDGGDPRGRGKEVPDYRKYEYGKEIYAVKLGCGGCPLGDKALDEALAKRIVVNDDLRATLTSDEDEAVLIYLRQRFGLLI